MHLISSYLLWHAICYFFVRNKAVMQKIYWRKNVKRTLILIALLVAGLLFSQLVPVLLGTMPPSLVFIRNFLTMSLLAFIMIEVGREFEIDLKNKKQYAVDYGVAATAAAFPWILVTLYFLFFLTPEIETKYPVWIEALLVGRFAAPTSAGVLFSMLAASGLAGTWVYKKTRILAIFDDLDTVLLMIPLQILIIGFVWQLGANLLVIATILFLGIKFYRKLDIPKSWMWVLGYSFVMVALSEAAFIITKHPESAVGLHVEILLPAFVLGCMLKKPADANEDKHLMLPGEDKEGLGAEELAGLTVSSVFMFLVGFSMPAAFGENAQITNSMSFSVLLLHVLAVTVLSNIGKMFACFCYKKEATLKERIAVAVAMFPRGEVGAGVLAVSLSYGISGPYVIVAFMSLALNLVLTGFFIFIVKKLLISSKTFHVVQGGGYVEK